MEETPTNPAAYELNIEEIVPLIDPKAYRIGGLDKFDPNKYYVTSGDAVQKAKVLERDLWAYAGNIRKVSCEKLAAEHKSTYAKAQALHRSGQRPKSPARWAEFETMVWKAAGAARKLVGILVNVRGDAIFLETEWQDHRLLCIPKNPRNQ